MCPKTDAPWQVLAKHFAEMSKRGGHGFEALPKRQVVKRTFAWLSQSRRRSKNDEITALFSRSLREDRLHSARSGS